MAIMEYIPVCTVYAKPLMQLITDMYTYYGRPDVFPNVGTYSNLA